MLDSDDEEHGEASVQLGFAYAVGDTLEKKLFEIRDWHTWDGGKVGGKPVWLDPRNLPASEDVKCSSCQWPMVFLLQIYCPLDDVEDAFHRAIYVFLCPKPSCFQTGQAKVLRCQLPRKNPFYDYEPDTSRKQGIYKETAGQRNNSELSMTQQDSLEQLLAFDINDKEPALKLCEVCGMRGPHSCGGCRGVYYCCREHQREHWKTIHKKQCVKKKTSKEQHEDSRFDGEDKDLESTSGLQSTASMNRMLFPEYEIDVVPEKEFLKTNDEDRKLIDRHLMSCESEAKDEENLTRREGREELDEDITQNELDKSMGLSEEKDPLTMAFLTRTSRAPEQILRYARWEQEAAMWVSNVNIPTASSIPCCPNCQGQRGFEFQIMPQLLYYLKVEDRKTNTASHPVRTTSIPEENMSSANCSATNSNPLCSQVLDWGTLVIYTCLNSCSKQSSSSSAYIEEYFWIQPPLK